MVLAPLFPGLPPESFLFLQPNYLVGGMIAQILLKSNLAKHLSILNPQNLDTSLLLIAITPGNLFPIKVSQRIGRNHMRNQI
jgi:hypothetical protein